MERHDIVPVHLAVQAMRDNGYRNTAYAVAELIDNSIQASAQNVELLLAEKTITLSKNDVQRLHEIAILDDGKGMDEKTLRMSLQFGNGTNLNSTSEESIGRFGMGLPASSISQCTKVEVWSWQTGADNAFYTYLDINKINSLELSEIPKPIKKKIPEVYKKTSKNFGKTGTLIVWSNLDRILWKTADPLIKNSEFIIGRLYRKFIEKDKVSIRMVAFNYDNPKDIKIDKEALPNDPGYLMKKTSCPKPFDKTSMFEKDGETQEIFIKYRGKEHKVKLTFSLAKLEARILDTEKSSGWLVNGKTPSSNVNPGSTDHGAHAKKNQGVSVVRANRELDLDDGWITQYDGTDRWWGVEISFPPGLDDIFGVTNNKQSASNFREIAQTEIKEILKNEQSYISFLHELEEDEDSKIELIRIAKIINDRLSNLRKRIDAQTANVRSEKNERHIRKDLLQNASTVITARANEGHTGTTDLQLSKESEAERKKEIKDVMNADGDVPASIIDQVIEEILKKGFRIEFEYGDVGNSNFFDVKLKAGTIFIKLNISHPAYPNLIEVLDKDVDGANIDLLKERLIKARDGMKLLLIAWARYEDEVDGVQRTRLQDVRHDWGKIARKFLEKD